MHMLYLFTFCMKRWTHSVLKNAYLSVYAKKLHYLYVVFYI